MASLTSQQSVATCTTELLATAAPLDTAALSALAADLAGFATVLAQRPTLRRTLTETTIPADQKSALARHLLADRVSPAALRVVAAAVQSRWTVGADLVEGLRRLGRTALFLQAERAGELDDVEDELFRFGRIVDAAPDLSVILDDPATTPQARVALVRRLLTGKAHALTLDLLVALAGDPGGRAFAHGIGELVQQAAERRERLVATVTSAVPLDGAEVDRLRTALARIYTRPVALHVVVDARLGGGLRVRIGDEVIDGSMSGRLDALRQQLLHG